MSLPATNILSLRCAHHPVCYVLFREKLLRRAFAHLPKQDRQRSIILLVVNDIRRMRNRVYQNEPIRWRLNQLQRQHQKFYSLSLGLSPNCAPGFSS